MTSAAAEAASVLEQSVELHSAADVDAAIARIAAGIATRYRDAEPVILAVMSGGAFTATALCRHLNFAYTFDYVGLSRYGNRLEGGEVRWRVPLPDGLAGRVVIVVDDVLDRGTTLAALIEALRARRVAGIAVAVLVRKAVATGSPRPGVDFVGFETDDIWLFGCGMDYKGYWRGLPALRAVPVP